MGSEQPKNIVFGATNELRQYPIVCSILVIYSEHWLHAVLTSLESSCWLMTVSAFSEACLLASARALSILERSAEIISWAFLSASDTAFCSSDMACLFTSFTASSRNEEGISREKRIYYPRRPLLFLSTSFIEALKAFSLFHLSKHMYIIQDLKHSVRKISY